MDRAADLRLEPDGAERFAGAACAVLREIDRALVELPAGRPGLRLREARALEPILSAQGAIGQIARRWLGDEASPVRAVLFDKSEAANWSLGWHQDRTIVVRERRDVPGFGPWTVKQGMLHVAPPFDLLATMMTLRVHLDPVPADNAPLLVAPGSHRVRVPESEIGWVVEACGAVACLAAAGDVWAYATPIVHASEAAARPARRRVLQIDYAAGALPGGLAWLGV